MQLTSHDAEATNYAAYADGKKLDYCVEANEEEGYAIVVDLATENAPIYGYQRSLVTGRIELRPICSATVLAEPGTDLETLLVEAQKA